MISSLWATEGDKPVRAQLEKDLSAILHRSTEVERAAFLERALEAIDEYRKLELPSLKVGLSRAEKMENLATAGFAFAAAVGALDEESCSLLQQRQRRVLNWELIPAFSKTTAASEWALITAKAAELLRRRRREGAPPSEAAPLIQSLASAYRQHLRKRPSAAREGIFARALAVLFQAAGLPEQGETAIRNALSALPPTDQPGCNRRPKLPRNHG
jgi:hypothetical protein